MNNEIERIAQHNDMSVEFVTWFFNEKKSACGEHWFLVLGAMWEGWKGRSIEMDRLAAENVGLNKFIKQSCYVYNGDGSDISDSYIPAHESPMMPVQSQSLLPVAAECLAIRDAFICYLTSENMANKPDADEQQVYDHCAKWVDAMCETPATDRIAAGIKADGRAEGINFAASRLAAAFNHGFVDKPMAEVFDVVRMILTAKEDLANDPVLAADGLSGEYAEESLAEWEAELREGADK